MQPPNDDHKGLFISSLLARHDSGNHSVRERLFQAYGGDLSAAGSLADRETLNSHLAQDFENGAHFVSIFQAEYEFVTGQLDAQLGAVCKQLLDGDQYAADFKSFTDFRDWWQTLNHFDHMDAEPDEAEMEIALEDLKKVYEVLSVPSASFDLVLDRYRAILNEHPGSALDIGQGMFAVMVAEPEGNPYLIGVHANSDGSIPQSEVEHAGFDFDASAFSEHGCWDGSSQEETILAFAQPQLVELPWLSQGQTNKSTSSPRMG